MVSEANHVEVKWLLVKAFDHFALILINASHQAGIGTPVRLGDIELIEFVVEVEQLRIEIGSLGQSAI